jgi:hypothetical protein
MMSKRQRFACAFWTSIGCFDWSNNLHNLEMCMFNRAFAKILCPFLPHTSKLQLWHESQGISKLTGTPCCCQGVAGLIRKLGLTQMHARTRKSRFLVQSDFLESFFVFRIQSTFIMMWIMRRNKVESWREIFHIGSVWKAGSTAENNQSLHHSSFDGKDAPAIAQH